jgi:hypothetical protein
VANDVLVVVPALQPLFATGTQPDSSLVSAIWVDPQPGHVGLYM